MDITKFVAVNMATAHPHFEPDGTVYNMGNSFKGGAKYNIIKFTPAEKGMFNITSLSSPHYKMAYQILEK